MSDPVCALQILFCMGSWRQHVTTKGEKVEKKITSTRTAEQKVLKEDNHHGKLVLLNFPPCGGLLHGTFACSKGVVMHLC
ncbi:hypothetical protein GDO81_010518 [Engystomops pustulosus]|uniref:Uncharacterized protein n=1 Tax=Engystomops pustulosus TaxID=76066 RepID=A0AAV7C218_ENGPU|nr:hypothetical protein GDO81_010518 [Engystomops pustulosus]